MANNQTVIEMIYCNLSAKFRRVLDGDDIQHLVKLVDSKRIHMDQVERIMIGWAKGYIFESECDGRAARSTDWHHYR